MIHATLIVIVWDKVPGATGYDIYKDGVKVSSTRTATTARLGVTFDTHVYEIRAKGVTAPSQSVSVNQAVVL